MATPPPPRRRRLASSIYSKSSVTTGVYVKDNAYAWLPAKIIKSTTTDSATDHDNDDNDNYQVTVSIEIPDNWHTSTVLSSDSTIEPLEDALMDANNNRNNNDDDSMVEIHRVVDVRDYENSELPLQNADNHHSKQGKRDMADLPFLHEAAILYNIKERHSQLLPYTRVGDIVVAMNPFLWIDGLYSQNTRQAYARNLIWQQQQNDDQKDFTFGSLYDRLGFDPHIYETSSLSYKGLATTGCNQTILVSGESGAGKTESVKILMESLATLQLTRPQEQEQENNKSALSAAAAETTRRVLQSNPVFEAFGNAKTIRNDNSSRFGKFTQLQFEVESLTTKSQEHDDDNNNHNMIPQCLLAGSNCTTYLLEKSRVVSHSQNERTYHVFYQLLAAPESYKTEIWTGLQNTTTDSFKYTCSGGETTTTSNTTPVLIDGVSDADQWPKTLEALKVFTLEGESLKTLMRALCVVLQLGNLTFDHDHSENNVEEGGTIITSRDALESLSQLSGISTHELEAAMTQRIIQTAYDKVHVQLRPSVAKDSCDALAKEIYARVFDHLVGKINQYTAAASTATTTATQPEQTEENDNDKQQKKKFGLISLLDIFGFERFHTNRFEQFCINYANERMQQKYVLDNFRQVQQEYIAEGIEIFDFAVVDNSKVLDLLEGRIGLIISLNEECIRPKGNDESYVYKIKVVHKEHERLIDEKLHHKTEFGIHHFAGAVTYTATKFVERNTDKLPEDLLHCASSSTNELIRSEFKGVIDLHQKNVDSHVVHRKRTDKTVLEKFRLQLKHLMAQMENTTTRYIRCIKPNSTMTPRLTDHYVTMHQLECAGLVTAITISRESFPNKLGYDTAMERFGLLFSDADRKNVAGMSDKDAVHYMLSNFLQPMAEELTDGTLKLPFACGKTKAYFRAGALEVLETKRLDYYTKRVVRVQRWIRTLQAQAKYALIRQRVIDIQAWARARNEWSRFQRKKRAALVLQCWRRMVTAKSMTEGLRKDRAATQLQTLWRRRSTAKISNFKRAANVIQRFVRNRKRKDNFNAKLAVVVVEARMDHKLQELQKQVSRKGACLPRANPTSLDRRVGGELLGEMETMFDYLRKEIFALRTKNADLKDQLRDVETEKRELETNVETAESAASVTRLQVAKMAKENATLVNELIAHKHETAVLRKEVKNLNASCEESLVSASKDYEGILEEREKEIRRMKRSHKKAHVECEAAKDILRAEIVKQGETHTAEVLRLKDELRRTQDSHHDYLAKLMDVLETTHAARETETARIATELQSVKEEKDAHIVHLQREVDMLREMNRKGGSQMRSSSSKQIDKEEVSAMQKEVERNAVARKKRAQKYKEVTRKLDATVTKSDASARDADTMKNMIYLLNNLYALEQSSQAKVNQEAMDTLEGYVVASDPNRTVEDLKAQLKEMEMQNMLLQHDATEKKVCQRCERRDQRRQEQQRRGEQQRQGNRKSSSFKKSSSKGSK